MKTEVNVKWWSTWSRKISACSRKPAEMKKSATSLMVQSVASGYVALFVKRGSFDRLLRPEPGSKRSNRGLQLYIKNKTKKLKSLNPASSVGWLGHQTAVVTNKLETMRKIRSACIGRKENNRTNFLHIMNGSYFVITTLFTSRLNLQHT